MTLGPAVIPVSRVYTGGSHAPPVTDYRLSALFPRFDIDGTHTIVGWVNFTSEGTPDTYRTIVGGRQTSGGAGLWAIQMRDVIAGFNLWDNVDQISLAGAVIEDTWQFFSLRRLAGISYLSLGGISNSATYTAGGAGDENILALFGGTHNGSPIDASSAGMSCVKVWDGFLSDVEVQAEKYNYAPQAKPGNLIGWYPLDQKYGIRSPRADFPVLTVETGLPSWYPSTPVGIQEESNIFIGKPENRKVVVF